MSLVVLRRWTFAIFAQTDIKNEVDDVIYETFYFDYICFCDVAAEQRKYLAQDPNGEFMMSGNKISVKTLDLNLHFSQIAAQLDKIVADHFAEVAE